MTPGRDTPLSVEQIRAAGGRGLWGSDVLALCDALAAAEAARAHCESIVLRGNVWNTSDVERYQTAAKRAEAAEARADAAEEAIAAALNELGVPGGDYPAPVANAVTILTNALPVARRPGVPEPPQ